MGRFVRALNIGFLALIAAGGAWAQVAATDAPAVSEADDEEAAAATDTPGPAEAPPASAAAPGLPPAPVPYTALRGASTYTLPIRPPQPASGRVGIEELGKTPDRPLSVRDQIYEQRLRSSFASAQGLQGSLDGSWILSVEGAGDLYGLELVDQGYGVVEGAWRDLRREGALSGSGFIDTLPRTGAELTLRFAPDQPDGGVVTATFAAGEDGRWVGALSQDGRTRSATLRRN